MKLIDKIKKIVGKEDKKIDITDYTNELLIRNEIKMSLIGKKIAG